MMSRDAISGIVRIKSINYGYVPTVLFRPKTLFAVVRFPSDANKLVINKVYRLKIVGNVPPEVRDIMDKPLRVEDIIGLRITLTPVAAPLFSKEQINFRSLNIYNEMLIPQVNYLGKDSSPNHRSGWGYELNNAYLIS